MTKDGKSKKRGASAKSKQPTPVSGWLWLGAGLLIGLFVAFLLFLKGQTPDVSIAPNSVNAPKQEAPANSAQSDNKSDKFNYDFYKLLPNIEVVVPEEEERITSGSATGNVQKAGTYLLQAGSFRRFEDADRQKATLAFIGIKSRIVKVNVHGDETWHRVHVGPYTDLAELNQVRNLLKEKKIETLLIRIKG